jgi:hypothetical protein
MTHGSRAGLAGVALALSLVFPVAAADDPGLERLATCGDSWRDWQKTSDPRLTTFAAHLRGDFTQKQGDAFVTPKTAMSIAGFRVLQVYPESVGMGVGFSVQIEATFDKAKKAFEAKFGKPLEHCEIGDGMRNCGLQFAAERTFMLMSSDKPGDPQALIGCYYLYER